MANTSLPNLTERTATANSDLIHVNSGGTDYKETKGNFLSDVNSSISALNNSLANKLNNGILLNPVQGASGMYCSSKGTLSTAETLTFSASANRFTALVFITGNDARLAIYYIGYKANAVNEATKIAGSTYSVTCSTSGTISVPVSMWTTVIVMGTAEMT